MAPGGRNRDFKRQNYGAGRRGSCKATAVHTERQLGEEIPNLRRSNPKEIRKSKDPSPKDCRILVGICYLVLEISP
jgi:hypothetical protein